MSPSELTNTIEQFIVYVHRNEAHFTYIYVYHTNVSEADIYKNPLQMSFHLYLFAIFISLWGSTHDWAPPMTLLTAESWVGGSERDGGGARGREWEGERGTEGEREGERD